MPLGSVVALKGNVQKLLIVSRAVLVGEDKVFFDYGACYYPEGMMGNSYVYFNKNQIKKVFFRGYSDEEEESMLEAIDEARNKILNTEQNG